MNTMKNKKGQDAERSWRPVVEEAYEHVEMGVRVLVCTGVGVWGGCGGWNGGNRQKEKGIKALTCICWRLRLFPCRNKELCRRRNDNRDSTTNATQHAKLKTMKLNVALRRCKQSRRDMLKWWGWKTGKKMAQRHCIPASYENKTPKNQVEQPTRQGKDHEIERSIESRKNCMKIMVHRAAQ